jgi:hypothetical protein
MAVWLDPVVKSMILCEDVLPGPEGTENVHLMNVFSAIRPREVPSSPYRLRQLCVFLQLTDAEGHTSGHIVGRHAGSDRTVFASPRHDIQFEDRLQMKWVVFRLLNCPFPDAGLYWIEFHCDGRWLAEQSVLFLGSP